MLTFPPHNFTPTAMLVELHCTTPAFPCTVLNIQAQKTMTTKGLVQKNTPILLKTHRCNPTCTVRYPCLRPVGPPGTTPSTGRPNPSLLLHSFHRNTLHRPPRLPPLVTLAAQVTAAAHEAGAADAAALDITALRYGAVSAAATGRALLPLSIPPAVRLDQSERRWVEQGTNESEGASRTNMNNRVKVQVETR